jgi:hypothetical protein
LNVTVSVLVTMSGGGVTVTLAVAVSPWDAAVIMVEPTARPSKVPLAETVAMVGSLELQVVGTPTNGTPLTSVATDCNRAVWPTATVVDSGDTASDVMRPGPIAVSVVQARMITVATALDSRLDVIRGPLGLLNGRDHPRPSRAYESCAKGGGEPFLATRVGVPVCQGATDRDIGLIAGCLDRGGPEVRVNVSSDVE